MKNPFGVEDGSLSKNFATGRGLKLISRQASQGRKAMDAKRPLIVRGKARGGSYVDSQPLRSAVTNSAKPKRTDPRFKR